MAALSAATGSSAAIAPAASASASGTNFTRGLSRTSSSGVLTPCNGASSAYASTNPNSTRKLAAAGAFGSAAAAGAASSGRGEGGEGGEGGRVRPGSAGGFRSEALQLEVRLAEGLQALADQAEAGDEGEGRVEGEGRALGTGAP